MKTSELYQLMSRDLPNITYQKRLSYRTSTREVNHLYKLINKEIFNNRLPHPEIQIVRRREYWGYCIAKDCYPKPRKSNCIIKLSDKWFCRQWLIIVLAHEMCHQYQWDIDSIKRMNKGLKPIMSHGPSFFKFKKKLEKYNIPLNRHTMNIKSWFNKQNYWRC